VRVGILGGTMIDRDLLNNVRPWIESTLGYELPEAGDFGLRIGVTPDNDDAMPLYAVRVDNTVAVAARSEWLSIFTPTCCSRWLELTSSAG